MTKYSIVDKPVKMKSMFSNEEQFMVYTLSTKGSIYRYFRDTEKKAIDLYNEKIKQLV